MSISLVKAIFLLHRVFFGTYQDTNIDEQPGLMSNHEKYTFFYGLYLTTSGYKDW